MKEMLYEAVEEAPLEDGKCLDNENK